MVLETILGYDLTGGGVMTAPGPSFTIKGPNTQRAYIRGYYLDGISGHMVVVTNPNNTDWESGFILTQTINGLATSTPKVIHWFNSAIPVQGGDVLVLTSTSGGNPHHCGLYVDYPPYTFKVPSPASLGEQYRLTRLTAAAAALTAGVVQTGLTTLTGWGKRRYTPHAVQAVGALTTNPFIGLNKLGEAYKTFWPLPLTDVAQCWHPYELPDGLFEIRAGDTVEVSWLSDTAESPTANVTFRYVA